MVVVLESFRREICNAFPSDCKTPKKAKYQVSHSQNTPFLRKSFSSVEIRFSFNIPPWVQLPDMSKHLIQNSNNNKHTKK